MEGGTVQLMDEDGNIIAITNASHKDTRTNVIAGKPIKAELGLPQGQYIQSNGQLYQIVHVPPDEEEPSSPPRATSRPAVTSSHLSPPSVSLLTPSSSAAESAEQRSKRHEILSRRPSYRKILNELSPGLAIEGNADTENLAKIEQTSNNVSTSSSQIQSPHAAVASTSRVLGIAPASPGVAAGAPSGGGGMVAVQTASGQLTVIPASSLGIAADLSPPSPNPLVQYASASSSEGGVVVSSSGSEDQVQNLSNSSIALPGGQRVIMTSAGLQLASDTDITRGLIEDTSRKREVRLFKNREAARECRRKKKEYVRCLENRVAVLENQNKALIEELKSLKDLYCNK